MKIDETRLLSINHTLVFELSRDCTFTQKTLGYNKYLKHIIFRFYVGQMGNKSIYEKLPRKHSLHGKNSSHDSIVAV